MRFWCKKLLPDLSHPSCCSNFSLRALPRPLGQACVKFALKNRTIDANKIGDFKMSLYERPDCEEMKEMLSDLLD